MFATIIVLLALAVGGGTAYVSDDARPGDALFGVDRTVENVRLTFAGGAESKNELRIRFAEERLDEVDKLSDDDSLDNSFATSSSATSTDDDGSDDRDDSNRRVRVETGLSLAASILEEISGDLKNEEARDRLLEVAAKLNARLSDMSAEDQSSLKGKIEIRTGDDSGDDNDGRIRIKTDDGRVRIEVRENDDDGDDSSDDSSSSSSDESSNSVRGLTEVEADIFTDITVVEFEINDQKTIFTTSAKTRDAIIGEIVVRLSGFTRAEIDAVLTIETEDRASRQQDLSNDDSSGSGGDDDDEDDDRSGSSGKGSGKIEIDVEND